MSIIPGIEALAPERTDISNGFSLSPNFVPIIFSTKWIPFSTSALIKATVLSFPILLYSVHISVVIVNPGGTETPIRFISARLAPFPPSRFFILEFPSAFLSPNR